MELQRLAKARVEGAREEDDRAARLWDLQDQIRDTEKGRNELWDNDDGGVAEKRGVALRDEAERPRDLENVGASEKDGARPLDTLSGSPRPPDDGIIRVGSPAPGLSLHCQLSLVSAPTIPLPVTPMPSLPTSHPPACDTGSRAEPSDPGAVASASCRSGVPDTRIKVEHADDPRMGRVDRDRPSTASRYGSLHGGGRAGPTPFPGPFDPYDDPGCQGSGRGDANRGGYGRRGSAS